MTEELNLISFHFLEPLTLPPHPLQEPPPCPKPPGAGTSGSSEAIGSAEGWWGYKAECGQRP